MVGDDAIGCSDFRVTTILKLGVLLELTNDALKRPNKENI
jgi:hypothetical protein